MHSIWICVCHNRIVPIIEFHAFRTFECVAACFVSIITNTEWERTKRTTTTKNVNHFPLYRKKPTKTLWEEKSVSKQVNIHRFDRLPFNSIHSIALRVNNNKQTNDKPTTSWLFIVFFSLAFFCRLFFTFSAMPTNGLCVPCALSLKWCAQRVKKIWQRNEKKKTEWIINKLYRNQRETNTTTQNE